jgi:hypothetical protein
MLRPPMTDRDRSAPRSAPPARGDRRPADRDRSTDRDRPAPRDRSAAPRDHSIHPSERPADGQRPVARTAAARRGASRPTVRGPSVKVPLDVARLVRAGHPWVFRHTVRRDLDTLTEGAVVPVLDEDGYGVGWGLVESEGAIGVRMLSLQADFVWNEAEMTNRLRHAQRQRGPALLGQGAVRLIHGEADGFPGVAVDRLGDFC